MSDSETGERSGGVNIDGEGITARDVIGRDQITAQTYIHEQIVQAAPAPAEWQPAWRVLTIVARPLNVAELPNIAEVSALMRGLAEVEAPILLRFLQPPTIESLRTALADAWDVIHFDGHGAASDDSSSGSGQALLAFERDDGTVEALTARRFVEMIARCPQPPRLIILSACESARGDGDGLAGELVRAGTPAVIGTRASVTVEWTTRLLRPLYAALGRGATIREAFEQAVPALRGLPNPASDAPAEDLAALLGPGQAARLCDGHARGAARVEQARLFGWTEPLTGAFHGDYIEGEPPQGRKGLIAQTLRALLRGSKLVALTGTGGIGKTVLGALVAQRSAWKFPGGVFWVDGRDYLDREIPLDDVLDKFAPILGEDLSKKSTSRKRDDVVDYMNDVRRASLIVMDNADVASRAALRFVSELPPGSAALLTTRTMPEARGTPIELHAMSPRESLRLLAAEMSERSNDPRWQQDVTDAQANALLEIARLLDGHPLALLQAAARAAKDGLPRTLALVRAHPAQGREISERFDFSYKPLPDAQKRLLHRLAAFAAGFDELTLQTICADEDFAAGEARLPNWLEDLRALRDKSLIETVETQHVETQHVETQHAASLRDEYRRFRLHPVMRDYVRGAERAGEAVLREEDLRAARFFVTRADAMARELGNTETALTAVDWADRERLNLLAAQETCSAQAQWDAAISLAYDLDNLFERTGHWGDRRRALERGIEAAKRKVDSNTVAELSHNLGVAFQVVGEYREARERFEESLEAKRQAKDKRGVAIELHQLGMLAQAMGDYAEARRQYEASLAIAPDLRDKVGVAQTLHNLGALAQDTGDYAEALRQYEASLTLERDLGNKAGVASSLHQLGMLAQVTGDYAEARQQYEASLALAHDLGDKAGVAQTLHQLGNLAYLTGDYAEARQQHEASLAIKRELGDKAGVARSLHQLGILAQATGDYAGAQQQYEASLAIKRELGDKAGVAISTAQLALLEEKEGNLPRALELIRAAEVVFVELGSPMREKAREVRERLEKKLHP